MKTLQIAVIALASSFAAHADFSYTQTRTGGPGAAAGGNGATKHYFKGQKMKTETAGVSTIVDFDSKTITSINHTSKSYTVKSFSEMEQALQGANMDAKVDVKQTGQKKNINGFNASEVVMTMTVDSPQTAQAGMKMTMEISMWLSPDPPGVQELRAFYQRNLDKFPWAALSGGGNSPMQKAMADMQKQVAKLGGVPVQEVVKMKSGDGQMDARMAAARAQMEAMRKQGGAQAQAAEQALARMGAMGGGPGSMLEITMESSGFSTAAIPDAAFAIPDGYQKK